MEGRVGSQRPVITSTRTQAVMLCLHWMTETNTITNYKLQHRLSTIHILVNVTHWLHKPCSAPSWFERVGKKPAVKADLSIYCI